jgi:hypothetical protein
LLAGAENILQWMEGQREALVEAQSNYVSWLARRLGSRLGKLERENPGLAKRIVTLLGQTDDDALRRVVTAPETYSRLLWGHPGACDERDFWQYFIDALIVESISSGRWQGPASHGSLWSAVGDVYISDDGAPISQPRPAGLIVDCESPAAICLHRDTFGPGVELSHYRDLASKQLALERLEAALCAVKRTDALVAEFVLRFTLVANVVVDGSSHFLSGSTGEYVGRSIFCNVHLSTVTPELLAESLVHEAIHSFLHIHEACDSWISWDNAPLFDSIESPWTGRMLPLRTFLQACFVWFGVLNFWIRAREASAFQPQQLEKHLAASRQGFLKGSILSRVHAYAHYVAPRVLELVTIMQDIVMSKRIDDFADQVSPVL